MRKPYLTLLILLSISSFTFANKEVQVIIPSKASSPEKIAARELTEYLGRIYPKTKFAILSKTKKEADLIIRLGTPISTPDLLQYINNKKLRGPESYVVTTATIDGIETGIILGADASGVMYGVYGLLEKLDCGFFLSYDAVAKPEKKFSLKKWKLINHPLTPERIVFTWHNFLSGCTGWDLEHWKKWIAQSQKSGFNTVMVHAYGNNPMFTYTFNGKTKPVGFQATTKQGRDWSVNHVNDIRRLHGGFLFNEPVFGSQAAKVTDNKLVEATQAMMHDAFEYAEQRGVKVNFAVDFDIPTCNPANMITLLDTQDRFLVRGVWIARPDTAGGYEFYKAQAKAIVDAYPQVDTITLWRRHTRYCGATWPLLKFDEMPKSWQDEYNAFIKNDPPSAKLFQSVPAFGMAKVAKAWRKALDELEKEDIELATGSWKLSWVPAAAKFFPEEIKLIPLDSEVARGTQNLRNDKLMKQMDEAIPDGRMIPVIWAHHDDGEYIGAPMHIHKQFKSKLKKWGAGGFGIIHWMTHPLDIYFTSHSRQIWASSSDEPLETTCKWVARRSFGTSNEELMGEYLYQWMTTMPTFGRETSDFFIDRSMRKYTSLDEAVSGCKRRIAILDKADVLIMTDDQKKRHQFFKEYEIFVSDFFKTQYRFEEAESAYKSGKLDKARELISACNPEELVTRFAKTMQDVGISRGEEGLIVTMNTRWIPHYVKMRQKLGLEAIRYNYAATSHEHLAQSKGIFTFHLSPDKKLWQTFGQKETGAKVFNISGNIAQGEFSEICSSGIESDKAITINITSILPRGSRGNMGSKSLPAGEYVLTLLLVEPTATEPGQRVMHVRIGGDSPQTTDLDIFKQAEGRNRTLALEYPVELKKPNTVTLTLTPTKGNVLICGVVFTPKKITPASTTLGLKQLTHDQ